MYDFDQLCNALYEANKYVDINTYNRRKYEAMQKVRDLENIDYEANTIYNYGRDNFDYGDPRGEFYKNIGRNRNVESEALEAARDIASWYENYSFDRIQAMREDDERKERIRQMEDVSNERQRRVRENERREGEVFLGNLKEMFRPNDENSKLLKEMRQQEKKPIMSIAERLERAKAYCDEGDYDRAIEEYNEILKSDPNNVDARFGRGAVCSGYGDNYDQAIADLGYVIQSSPDNAIAYYFRAHAYSNKGATLKALADCNRAIQLEPNNANMYFCRSVVYLNIEKYDRAISDCDQAIRLDPRNVQSYIGRGTIYYDKKSDCKRAIEDFEAALRIDPGNAIARQWLEKARRKM